MMITMMMVERESITFVNVRGLGMVDKDDRKFCIRCQTFQWTKRTECNECGNLLTVFEDKLLARIPHRCHTCQ